MQTNVSTKSKLRSDSSEFVVVFVLLTTVLVAAAAWLCVLQLQHAKDDAGGSLDRTVQRLADAVRVSDLESIKRITAEIGTDSNVDSMFVRDAQNRLLAAVDKRAAGAARRSFAVSITPKFISSFTVDRQFASQSSALGSVRVAYTVQSLASSFVWLVCVGICLMAVALLLLWRVHVRLVSAVILPLQAIERVSDQITRTGDMSHRMPQLGSRESQQLEETVNRMLEQLDEQEQKKNLYRTGLEREVAERTAALASTSALLQKLAYVSTETALPNRAAFLDRLHKLCVLPHDSDLVFGLFVIRISRVRYANEAFGFDVGDLMIEMAARTLSAIRAPESELFHLGGGEFAVIHSDYPDSIQDIANEMLRADDVPFVYRGATLTLQPKIGYAVFPKDATEVDDLTRCAMLALNAATAPNAQQPTVAYDKQLQESSLALAHLESAIKNAVDTGQFEPHFQSRVDTETGRVQGLEAFIRWTSPELLGFSNYQLIPIAERSLLAAEIDLQMLRKVVEWLSLLAADGIFIPVAMNLSLRSLQRLTLPDEILALVGSLGVDITQIEFELDETVLKEKSDVVGCNIALLHEMGCRLLLADFGSGYSSLRYVRDLPISILKIGRAFVQGLPEDASSLAIMQSTVNLAHQLGKRVVAEGVETYAQWESLRALGCDEVQGHFLMRPQGPCVVAEMLREQFDSLSGHMTVDLASIERNEEFLLADRARGGQRQPAAAGANSTAF